MAKNLVLVESPSKAKTINKYLGRNYIVQATVGHVKNLPKTKLGIDIENDFKVQLLNIRGKGDTIKKIRQLAGKAEKIFVATDPDREGEAIAQDIVEILDGKTKAHIYRVLFNEITKNAVKKAMDSPLEIDDALVQSQRARRVMDRIIGYSISPLLWRAILEASGNSLSAGRVQSVALRLICEREELIENFIPTEYWIINAEFTTKDGDSLVVKLAEQDGKQLKIQPKPEMTDKDWNEFLKKNFAISNEDEAVKILNEIKNAGSFFINDISKKESRRNPSPPFITSTLQAEASRKLGFRPRKTMRVAQSLYEGVKLGKSEIAGLITYMRTDSTRLSDDIIPRVRDFIHDSYGKKYLPHSAKSYDKKNKKNVQDAHEAIRPTTLNHPPQDIKEFLDKDQFKIYQLIWQRFVACQMQSAKIESTNVSVKADKYILKASGSVVTFDGFLKVYQEAKENNNGNGNNENTQIPVGLELNQKLKLQEINKNQQFTKPSPRYTESSLIKELESNGIGRPSTYASIIGTIQDRYYIEQNEKKLVPTDLGKRVNSELVKNFPKILDVNFTAKMEEELDMVASKANNYVQVLEDFYGPFSKQLTKVKNSLEKVICEKCGSEMEIKIGRYGKYFACTAYPKCKNIKSTNEIKVNEPEYTGETCPKCGKRTVYRTGRYGKFIGCENYPECDFTKQITLGINCPVCHEGDVVSRRSKSGRYFYGCSNYPKCDYMSWNKPKAEEVQEDN